jgi:GH25 family lysozyme M1 (1,4-beta-N-acetylmuramidase)
MQLGCDISHWQDAPGTPKEINFTQMKMAGANFVIFKATQGKWTDRVYQISWDDAGGVLPRGAYCYLDYSVSGLEQAKYFCNAIMANPMPELCIVADFECRVNVPANANAHLWNWLEYVEKQTKIVPWIYTGPSYWKEFGSTKVAWKKYPLWIANYSVSKPTIPKPWTECICWQFTSKGNGTLFGAESLNIDLDYLYTTLPLPPVPAPTLEERVTALEKVAHGHEI